MLKSCTVNSDLAIQETGAIEVVVHLEDDTRRWCYFMTPHALAMCGDWISGTRIRFHCNAPYMIVLNARLDMQIIGQALQDIDRHGKLEQCTMAYLDETVGFESTG